MPDSCLGRFLQWTDVRGAAQALPYDRAHFGPNPIVDETIELRSEHRQSREVAVISVSAVKADALRKFPARRAKESSPRFFRASVNAGAQSSSSA